MSAHAHQPSGNPPPPAQAPAWDQAALATNPHDHADKAARVQAMFAAIANSYDLNNRLHSLWQDQAWRRFAVRKADVRPGDHVLDVACGTGDLTQAFARTPAARVVGLDFTQQMLDLAELKRRKRPQREASRIEYLRGDAMDLPFPDATFDVVSIAFGIRNVQQPPRALAEFARVLRPGGRLVILEFDRPTLPPVRWFNDLYCARIMPATASVIARDRSGAYRYLPKSVEGFMPREELLNLMRRSGFNHVYSRSLTLGICACSKGTRDA